MSRSRGHVPEQSTDIFDEASRLPAADSRLELGNQAALDLVRSQAPGAAMDLASSGPRGALPFRAEMEARFGVDLSGVQVTKGGQQAQAGLTAMGADAATDGERFAFMDANPSKEKVAHEVAHFAQGADGGAVTRASAPGSSAEREAEDAARVVSQGGTPQITESAPSNTVHGSWWGAVPGALAGAALGPIGMLGGAWLGDRLTSDRRELTEEERAYARRTYGDSVDLDDVNVVHNSIFSTGCTRTIGNSIYVEDGDYDEPNTSDNSMNGGTNTVLTHEMGHVWQYQNGGMGYAVDALWNQARAALGGGDRGGAYNWRDAQGKGVPWDQWNAEQQAEAMQEYNYARTQAEALEARVANGETLTPEEQQTLASHRQTTSTLQPHVDSVRAGEGAATFGWEDIFGQDTNTDATADSSASDSAPDTMPDGGLPPGGLPDGGVPVAGTQ